jgi:hypothetical protein
VLPSASGTIEDFSQWPGTPATFMDNILASAYKWVNGRIAAFTATPNTNVPSLTMAEAYYGAYMLLLGTSGPAGDEDTFRYTLAFREEAERIIDSTDFPASATTPSQASGFVGNGTITVTTNDYYTPTATWEVRYLGSNSFGIWNTTTMKRVGTYDIVQHSQFPDPDETTTNGAVANKDLVIKITAGATAFGENDTWFFKTFESTKRSRSIKSGRMARG